MLLSQFSRRDRKTETEKGRKEGRRKEKEGVGKEEGREGGRRREEERMKKKERREKEKEGRK